MPWPATDSADVRSISATVPTAPPWAHIASALVISAEEATDALTQLERLHTLFVPSQVTAAERLIRVTSGLGRGDLRRRAELVSADAAIRQGDAVAGAAIARRVLPDAEQAGDGFALARAHYLLAWAAHTIGDMPGAQINGVRSVELLPAATPQEIVMDHLTITAIAFNPSAESDAYFAETLEIARQCGDPVRTFTLHNNIAYAALERGDLDTARRHVALMLDEAALADIPAPVPQLETAGRLYIEEGRFRDAVEVMQPVADLLGAPESDAASDFRLTQGLLTLARAWRGLDDFDRAHYLLDEAMRRASLEGTTIVQAQITEERAHLRAAQGDFRGAFDDYVAFHDAIVALQSEDQQAKARIAQASFNAERNRQQAEHFRDLAMRDSLTGLYNRRYLDELLAAAVERAARNAAPLSLAIIDADYFKRINDELSHEIGDGVLRTLASVLLQAKPRGSTVCRLGGEEFALVLPGTPATAALGYCEEMRVAVADYPWEDLTRDIPLTVSIGVATAPIGRTTSSALLAEADRFLYGVKRSGRNRVMGDTR